ncbi:TetR family transcriptional regulator [Mycobacterium sp. THU-M104]|uniref:TetR family transcriptional regulator n=1 Tax=Mycobacterium sp. THU-M104 TaxID=3410515 RepID=UPI003B9BED82
MARQVRSEATRRRILDAAIDVFGDVGYAAAAWGTIIERTGMTKGALYHHFDSKESLASAIIDEGSDALLGAFRHVCGTSSPALENMIHGTFTIATMVRSDKVARTAEHLICALSGFNDSATRFCAGLIELMSAEAQRAIDEGDLRSGLGPERLGESIVGTMLGTRLISNLVRADGVDEDLVGRTGRMWDLLLAGVVDENALAYFRQFLAREALRHAQPDGSATGVTVAGAG